MNVSVRRCLVWLSMFGLLVLEASGGLSGDDIPRRAPGSINGVVRFTGTVPPPKEITVTDGRTIQHNDLVVDSKTKGLRYVVAVLEDAPAQPKVEKSDPVIVDQRDMVFIPRVVAVQHGQAVRFDNSDLFNHSVMAASTVKDNTFNTFVVQGKPYDHTFTPQKHPVQIGCSLHPWMRAWVYVLPHPWFAVSDEKGRFKIEKVPAGKYTVWLRHADTGHQERISVAVKSAEITELKIEWPNTGK
jgi:plastocyanin